MYAMTTVKQQHWIEEVRSWLRAVSGTVGTPGLRVLFSAHVDPALTARATMRSASCRRASGWC